MSHQSWALGHTCRCSTGGCSLPIVPAAADPGSLSGLPKARGRGGEGSPPVCPALTTHVSQTTDSRSSTPFVPSGMRVKLSLPTAFWAVLKVQWALPVTWRSPLGEDRDTDSGTTHSWPFFPGSSTGATEQGRGTWCAGRWPRTQGNWACGRLGHLINGVRTCTAES